MKGLTLFIILLLTGCLPYHVQVYKNIDKNEKIINVPPGAENIIGKIKSNLYKDGWKMFVKNGPYITEGTFGNNVQLKHFNQSYSRYEITIDTSYVDTCFIEGMYNYDISIADNKTGEEVIAISGRDCESSATKKVIDEINKITK